MNKIQKNWQKKVVDYLPAAAQVVCTYLDPDIISLSLMIVTIFGPKLEAFTEKKTETIFSAVKHERAPAEMASSIVQMFTFQRFQERLDFIYSFYWTYTGLTKITKCCSNGINDAINCYLPPVLFRPTLWELAILWKWGKTQSSMHLQPPLSQANSVMSIFVIAEKNKVPFCSTTRLRFSFINFIPPVRLFPPHL